VWVLTTWRPLLLLPEAPLVVPLLLLLLCCLLLWGDYVIG
jgi:hypothetical protein